MHHAPEYYPADDPHVTQPKVPNFTYGPNNQSKPHHQYQHQRQEYHHKQLQQEQEQDADPSKDGKEEGKEECANTATSSGMMHAQHQLDMLRHENLELQAALDHMWERFAQVEHEQTLIRVQQEHEQAKSEFTAKIEKEYLETKSRLRAAVDQRLDAARATVEQFESQNQELRRILRRVQRDIVVRVQELNSDIRCLHLALDAMCSRLLQPALVAINGGSVNKECHQEKRRQQRQHEVSAGVDVVTDADACKRDDHAVESLAVANFDFKNQSMDSNDSSQESEKAVPIEKQQPTSMAGSACYELLIKVQECIQELVQKTKEMSHPDRQSHGPQQMTTIYCRHSGIMFPSSLNTKHHSHHRQHHHRKPSYHHRYHHHHSHHHRRRQGDPHHSRKSSCCSYSSQTTTTSGTLVPSIPSSCSASSCTSASSPTSSPLLPATQLPIPQSSSQQLGDQESQQSPLQGTNLTTTLTTSYTMQEKLERWYEKALHHLQKRYSHTLRAQNMQHERDIELVKQQCVDFYSEALKRVRSEIQHHQELQQQQQLQLKSMKMVNRGKEREVDENARRESALLNQGTSQSIRSNIE
ncbi:hypothetical protein BGW41_008360 [Actinomortierella wolfii]|nr:hypothetical protein BGW41_008360 [Actinomortierella wolfii]